MQCVLDLVVLDIFLVVGHLLQAYNFFLIDSNWTRAHNHLVHKRTLNHLVSGRNLASKISLPVLLSDGQNVSRLSRFFSFVVFGYMRCCFF